MEVEDDGPGKIFFGNKTNNDAKVKNENIS